MLAAASTFLLAGNVYFIKRLVDKIESTSETANRAISAFSNLSLKVDEMSATMNAQLGNINTELKHLRRVEIDVAVLKTQLEMWRDEA